MQSGNTTTLTVHRLQANYLVSSQDSDPHCIKASLDTLAQSLLPSTVGAALSMLLPASAPDVWLIRSLEVDLDIGLHQGEDAAARSWARQIACTVADVVLGQTQSDETLHFPDPVAYLAQFLADLAEGSAWGKWYYRKFEGLRFLPVSAALRTAVCRDSETGRQALVQLSMAQLSRIIESLNEHDAGLVLDAIAPQAWEQKRNLLQEIDTGLFGEVSFSTFENRSALLLYLKICSRYPHFARAWPGSLALAAVRLKRIFNDTPVAEQRLLLLALEGSDLISLYRLRAGDAEVLRTLFGSPMSCLSAMVGPNQASDFEDIGARRTSCGGIFFLLPLLAEMPLAEITADWPSAADCLPSQLVRLVLLMKCVGTSAAAPLFEDSLVRDLLELSPKLSALCLAQWLKSLSFAQLARMQAEILRWQWRSEHDFNNNLAVMRWYQRQSLLCFDSSQRLLLLAIPDSFAGREWLHNFWLQWIPGHAQAIDKGPSLLANQREEIATRRLSDQNGIAAPSTPENEADWLIQDLDFLALPRTHRGSKFSELAFSAVAHGLVRSFSRKLPGFASASPAYIHHNFLATNATLEDQPAQRIVRLAAPPLHVVITMAGLDSQRYDLSWTGPRPFVLFPER